MDLLKGKFKKVTLKFYDKDDRHNYTKCLFFFHSILEKEKKNITYYRFYGDYDDHVGYHFNGVLKSNSYKHLRAMYTDKSDLKVSGVYLWNHEINSTDEYNDWLEYCIMRQSSNFTWQLRNDNQNWLRDDFRMVDRIPRSAHINNSPPNPSSPQLTEIQFEN